MKIKPLFSIIVVLSLWPLGTVGTADRIYLKDGTIEQSDRIWESDNYFHFILKGTENVEIRYAKAIVDHVDRDTPGQSHKNAYSDLAKEGSSDGESLLNKARNPKIDALQIQHLPANPVHLPDGEIIKENNGIAFYDPRRKDRYWASRQSRHGTLKSALSAISEIYGRSSPWVEEYMGETNELGAIHRNLIGQLKRELAGVQAKETKTPTIASEAGGPDSSSSDIPMGTPASSKAAIQASTPLQRPRIGKGILFYDPRRSQKYWTGQLTRYNTLGEAISALAAQYQVSEQWVATHMGETNDLAQIHRNIQENIVSSSSPSN